MTVLTSVQWIQVSGVSGSCTSKRCPLQAISTCPESAPLAISCGLRMHFLSMLGQRGVLMRGKVFVVLLAVFALSVTAAFGADMFSGTWKLNIAKSKIGTRK